MAKFKPVIIVLCIMVALFILLVVAHEMIEARIFRELAHQPGMQLTIGSRSGNLLGGYNLRRVVIRQNARGETPPFTMNIPILSIHWKLYPFQLTEIGWDAGTFSLENRDGTNEDIEFASTALMPGISGWLESDSPVRIGPERWNGSLTLKIRQTGGDVDGQILIERFPSRLIRSFGDIPSGINLPNEVRIEATISGPLSNIQTDAAVMDPFSHQRYRF